jgi:hypothetical protein
MQTYPDHYTKGQVRNLQRRIVTWHRDQESQEEMLREIMVAESECWPTLSKVQTYLLLNEDWPSTTSLIFKWGNTTGQVAWRAINCIDADSVAESGILGFCAGVGVPLATLISLAISWLKSSKDSVSLPADVPRRGLLGSETPFCNCSDGGLPELSDSAVCSNHPELHSWRAFVVSVNGKGEINFIMYK